MLEIAAACATPARRRSASATRPAWPTRARCASSSRAPRAALGDGVELTAHFHNTRGQGLANVLAALEAGVESFESSFGELGGCPVPAGATGNIATEDLVSMLHEMGIETGIDLPALLACARARAGDPRPPARQPHAARRARRLAPRPRRRRRGLSGRGPSQRARPPSRRPGGRSRARRRCSTPGRRPPSRASARARGARRRRSRAWRGRRRRASWRAVPRPAPASRPRARSGATTRLTRPMRSASAASIMRAVMISSFARPSPTTAGSRVEPPTSGMIPNAHLRQPELARRWR